MLFGVWNFFLAPVKRHFSFICNKLFICQKEYNQDLGDPHQLAHFLDIYNNFGYVIDDIEYFKVFNLNIKKYNLDEIYQLVIHDNRYYIRLDDLIDFLKKYHA